MSKQTITTELRAALALEPMAEDTPESYAKKLALKANKISDDDWASLTEASQRWINAGLEAIENKQPVQLPEGVEAVFVKPPKSKEKAATKPKAAKPEKAPKAEKVEAKETKPEKAEKPAKKKKGGEKEWPGKRGPRGEYGPEATIKLIVKENPHRSGVADFKKFAAIEDGMKVSEAVAAGVDRGYLRYASNRALLEIHT